MNNKEAHYQCMRCNHYYFDNPGPTQCPKCSNATHARNFRLDWFDALESWNPLDINGIKVIEENIPERIRIQCGCGWITNREPVLLEGEY